MTARRHRWGEPVRFAHKSERTCIHCGLVKASRHEGSEHWNEYWRGLDRIETRGTPPCPGAPTTASRRPGRPETFIRVALRSLKFLHQV